MSRSKLAGWILSGLLALLLMGPSALGKFLEYQGKAENFAKLGYTTDVMFKIGFVEVIIAVLYIIPRTGFIGAILITAYLGGATATHVRVGEPAFAPPILGIVVWIALGLRQPEIFTVAFGGPERKLPWE